MYHVEFVMFHVHVDQGVVIEEDQVQVIVIHVEVEVDIVFICSKQVWVHQITLSLQFVSQSQKYWLEDWL